MVRLSRKNCSARVFPFLLAKSRELLVEDKITEVYRVIGNEPWSLKRQFRLNAETTLLLSKPCPRTSFLFLIIKGNCLFIRYKMASTHRQA